MIKFRHIVNVHDTHGTFEFEVAAVKAVTAVIRSLVGYNVVCFVFAL